MVTVRGCPSVPVHGGTAIVEEPATRSGSLTCDLYSSFESLEGLREEWDSLVIETESTFFMSFDWCRIWWRHFGRGRELRVFIFRDRGRIVGIVPLFVQKVRLGLVSVRVAKTLGAEYLLCLCDLPIQAGCERECVLGIIDRCLKVDRCDQIVFGPMGKHLKTVEAIQEMRMAPAGAFTVRPPKDLGVNTHYPILDSLDQYIHTLNKGEQKHYRRQMKRFEQEHAVDFHPVEPKDAQEAFEAFADMHGTRWHGAFKLGHFGDWPGSLDFHRDLVRDQVPKGRLRLFCLKADREPIAYRYVYSFGGCYYSLLPARQTAPQWDMYGLGLIGHVLTIARAAQEPVGRIDAGRGYYDHKVRRGGRMVPICSVEVVAGPLSSRIRACLFRALGAALHLAYYRVWFTRIAPRLPLRRRPLWKCWIESRL